MEWSDVRWNEMTSDGMKQGFREIRRRGRKKIRHRSSPFVTVRHRSSPFVTVRHRSSHSCHTNIKEIEGGGWVKVYFLCVFWNPQEEYNRMKKKFKLKTRLGDEFLTLFVTNFFSSPQKKIFFGAFGAEVGHFFVTVRHGPAPAAPGQKKNSSPFVTVRHRSSPGI